MKVLKFGAIWCKECLVMRPMWQEIEKAMPELETEYFDADENDAELEKWQIKDVPAFVFLDRAGKELFRLQGAQNKEKLIDLVNEYKNK